MDSFSGYRKWFKTDPEVYLGSSSGPGPFRESEGQKGSSSSSLRGAGSPSVSERGRESGRDMASQREKDTERSSGLSPGRHREYMVMKGMVDDIYDGRNNGMYEQYRHRQDNSGMYKQYRQDTHDVTGNLELELEVEFGSLVSLPHCVDLVVSLASMYLS